MAAAITATLQTTQPPRGLVTVTGLTGATAATVYRIVGSQRTPVRPAPLTIGSGTAVLVDSELPFNVDVTYVVSVTRAGITSDEATSTPAIRARASLPVLSDPIVGQGVSVTIATWPEYTYAARTAVVLVAGRRAPVVETDVLVSASSVVTLAAPTQATLTAVRALLATGAVVLLRAVCAGVEDAYLAVTQVTERRNGTPGKGWFRWVDIEAQHVDAPAIGLAATGDTLSDLNKYVPTTLQAIATRFPGTLLDIATTQLSGL